MKIQTLFSLLLIVLLTACGSVSGIKPNNVNQEQLDLTAFDDVVVLDFSDGTKKQDMPAFAGAEFADRIAAAIRGKAIFNSVSRQSIADSAVVISGEITKYQEGNGALKVFIGFGAGSTRFDALVAVSNNQTGLELGSLIVDKNSWALGGFVAGAQNIDGFMDGAANKIADELAKAKQSSGD